jgi:hypothetical protein
MQLEGSHGEGRLTPAEVSGLAAAVASKVGAILPDGFSCIVHDATVILVWGDVGVRSLDLTDAPEWRAENWAEDLRVVLWQVLSDFQDEIVEQLRQAWPTVPGAAGIAVPHARIKDGTVRAWYGTDEDAVVSLQPIGAGGPAGEERGDTSRLA